MIDIEVLESWFNFFMGVIIAIGGAYTTMKAQGKIVYPAAKIEAGRAKIAALMEDSALVEEAKVIVGTISREELAEIIKKVESYSPGGYTKAEAEEIGVMFFDAILKN